MNINNSAYYEKILLRIKILLLEQKGKRLLNALFNCLDTNKISENINKIFYAIEFYEDYDLETIGKIIEQAIKLCIKYKIDINFIFDDQKLYEMANNNNNNIQPKIELDIKKINNFVKSMPKEQDYKSLLISYVIDNYGEILEKKFGYIRSLLIINKLCEVENCNENNIKQILENIKKEIMNMINNN